MPSPVPSELGEETPCGVRCGTRGTTFIGRVGRLQTETLLRFLRPPRYLRACAAFPRELSGAAIEGVSNRLGRSSRRRAQTGKSRRRRKTFQIDAAASLFRYSGTRNSQTTDANEPHHLVKMSWLLPR